MEQGAETDGFYIPRRRRRRLRTRTTLKKPLWKFLIAFSTFNAAPPPIWITAFTLRTFVL